MSYNLPGPGDRVTWPIHPVPGSPDWEDAPEPEENPYLDMLNEVRDALDAAEQAYDEGREFDTIRILKQARAALVFAG